MNREEYEQRRQHIERVYLQELANLEADWIAAHPDGIFKQIAEKPTDRTRRTICSLEGEFRLEDIYERHNALYPGERQLHGGQVGRLLAIMVMEGEVEVVKYGGLNHSNIWRRVK